MPKMKTRRSAAKRFKVTGTGEFKRGKAFRSHILEHIRIRVEDTGGKRSWQELKLA